MEDFRSLVDAIHDRGMKCIIDVVSNHTSPDSILAEEHPEFFYHKPDGTMGNHVGDWIDVVELDYSFFREQCGSGFWMVSGMMLPHLCYAALCRPGVLL